MPTEPPAEQPANRWLAETGGTAGEDYDDRFAEVLAAGGDVHGEAAFVDALLAPGSAVLDAGCGTGRVAVELARRGHRVVGLDLDASMLARARAAAPGLPWVLGDLATAVDGDVGAPLDAVVLAGNVLVYLTPGTEAAVVARAASWLRPGGLLVAGYAADRHVAPADLRAWGAAVGLVVVAEHGAWDPAAPPPAADADYAVQVLARPPVDARD